MAKRKTPENKQKTGPERDARGRFVSGSTGNAGGRPKDSQETKDAKELLRSTAPLAVRLLIDTMNDEDARMDLRVRCAETVLDRVYGKASQPIEGSLGAEIRVVIDGGEDLSG